MDDLLHLGDEWAPLFKILGDPTRLKLLLAMHYRGPAEATVSELADLTGIKTATASAALKNMEAAGIISPVKDGREVRHRLIDDRIHEMLHHLGGGHKE